MIRPALRRLVAVCRNEVAGRRLRRLHYVADNADWSFKWDAHYITQGLKNRHQIPVAITPAPWELRHQVILFGNRYAWFFGPSHKIHRSNAIYLIWFHGDPNDPNPRSKQLFDKLPQALDRVRRVVVTGTVSRRILLEHGVAPEKIVTIPLGVDLNLFHPPTPEQRRQARQSWAIPEQAFCIGSFQKDGNGWQQGNEPKWVKGPDLFLETIARLKKSAPDLMVLLTGPARGYVKNGLDRLGVAYRHRFLDNYPDIVPCYQALDLYIITSRAEGGPKALLESWACGIPVVSTPVGMSADLIISGQNGLIADFDPVSLSQQAAALIQGPEKQTRIRNEGLSAVTAYDWRIIADRYYDMVAADVEKQ